MTTATDPFAPGKYVTLEGGNALMKIVGRSRWMWGNVPGAPIAELRFACDWRGTTHFFPVSMLKPAIHNVQPIGRA